MCAVRALLLGLQRGLLSCVCLQPLVVVVIIMIGITMLLAAMTIITILKKIIVIMITTTAEASKRFHRNFAEISGIKRSDCIETRVKF